MAEQPAAPVQVELLSRHSDSSEAEQDPAPGNLGAGGPSSSGKKKKKKKKGGKKSALPPLSWDDPLIRVTPYSVLNEDKLAIFRTPGCKFSLNTSATRRTSSAQTNGHTAASRSEDNLVDLPSQQRPDCEAAASAADRAARPPGRLTLRAVELGDEEGIQRIKCEPMVQKTQLYGNPRPGEIKRSFLLMYILHDMPLVRHALIPSEPPGKRQFTFALSLSPTGVQVVTPHPPPAAMRHAHVLRDEQTSGYIGNIALQLETEMETGSARGRSIWAPRPGEVWTWPSAEQAGKSRLKGKMFYELHPQLWRMGLMREAVEEVVRFGIEDLGVLEISVDPTEGNVGSIKLATDLGFVFQKRVHTEAKPQLWHVLTRKSYFERAGRTEDPPAGWAGKRICRWCMVYHGAEPTVRCEACDWGRWCSSECRRADWLYDKGHRAAGGCARRRKEGK